MASDAAGRLQAFTKAVASGSTSQAVDELLVSLKITVAEAEGAGAAVAGEARTLYENAALYSLLQNDTDGFERHYALAKCANADCGAGAKPSAQWSTVQGLYFMHLLVQNRLAEFHSELEVTPAAQLTAPQVAFPISIEQCLAEGRYNKVLDAIRTLPDPRFKVFVAPLVDAVRGEIADCSSAAYKSLPVAAAQRMMLFDTEAELLEYVATAQTKWTVDAGVISFNQDAVQRAQVPAVKLINNTLEYASELERIV